MSLPKINVSPERLYKMCHASTKSRLLVTAIELKIFNHLSDPKTSDQVAQAINGHPENTMLLLNALVSCRLLHKHKGRYQNTPLAQTFLVEGGPVDLAEGLLNQTAMIEKVNQELSTLVLEGPANHFFNDAPDSEERWARHASWIANTARAGMAQQMSDIVSGLPEFPGFRKMLDLGGGPGIFCIAMVDKHPVMKGVVFDRKPVVDVAASFIKEYKLEKRVGVLAGDYNKDSIGDGYDFIWASASLNFAQNNMETVMGKIYNALNPNGVFINLSEGITDEGTSPEFYTLYKAGWAMSSPVKAFEQGFIADAMLNAGFKSVRSRTLDTGWGQRDLDIARK